MGECGAKFIGPWTGNIYICNLTHPHTHHKGYCGEDEREWVNYQDYCAQGFPGTNDICKRPPRHKGYCRIKLHGNVIRFKTNR